MSKSYSLICLAIQLLDWCGLTDINFTPWVVIIIIIISVVAKIVPVSDVVSSFELSAFETLLSFFKHSLLLSGTGRYSRRLYSPCLNPGIIIISPRELLNCGVGEDS